MLESLNCPKKMGNGAKTPRVKALWRFRVKCKLVCPAAMSCQTLCLGSVGSLPVDMANPHLPVGSRVVNIKFYSDYHHIIRLVCGSSWVSKGFWLFRLGWDWQKLSNVTLLEQITQQSLQMQQYSEACWGPCMGTWRHDFKTNVCVPCM